MRKKRGADNQIPLIVESPYGNFQPFTARPVPTLIQTEAVVGDPLESIRRQERLRREGIDAGLQGKERAAK